MYKFIGSFKDFLNKLKEDIEKDKQNETSKNYRYNKIIVNIDFFYCQESIELSLN